MIVTGGQYRVSLMNQDDRVEFQQDLSERFIINHIHFEDQESETLITLEVQGKLLDGNVMFYLPDHINLLYSTLAYKEDGKG